MTQKINKIREIKLNCKNCGDKRVIEVPKGKRFTSASYFNGNFARIGGTREGYFADEHVDCENCGCGELSKTYD